MELVCDAPARAEADPEGRSATRADLIAKHLTDGVGNPEVLDIVEGWKTEGIDRAKLAKLVKRAKLARCSLQAETN